jgi:hypothetical protein
MDSTNGFQDIFDFFNSNMSNENKQNVKHDDELRTLINYFQECDKFESERTTYEVCRELNCTSLEKLFKKEVLAIHIPNFVSRELCAKIYKNIESDLSSNIWENTDMFQGYGLPVNYMFGPTANECVNYFSQVLPIIRKLRSISGGISPVDKLRLELDEIWPDGSKITNSNPFKRKAFVGLTRLMRPEGLVGNETKKNGLVHIDGPLNSNSESGTYSSNIYIKTPSDGGELCLWDISLTKNNSEKLKKLEKLLENAFDRKYREEIQSLLQNILPNPIVIKPEIGDLILLNSCQPHAVKGFQTGVRLSMQTFIHFENGKPLELYS